MTINTESPVNGDCQHNRTKQVFIEQLKITMKGLAIGLSLAFSVGLTFGGITYWLYSIGVNQIISLLIGSVGAMIIIGFAIAWYFTLEQLDKEKNKQ